MRSAKKFFFGLFYIALVILISFGVYNAFSGNEPTCSDNILNQNETGVDCGGSCISCEVKNLNPITTGKVSFFGLENGRTVFIGELVNANESFFADDVQYSFVIKDKSGYAVEKIYGAETVFPLEKRKVFTSEASTPFSNIGEVELDVTSPPLEEWKNFYSTLKPNVSIISGPIFSEDEKFIQAKGMLSNQSSVSADEVKLVAVFYNKYEEEIFASQWTTSNLSGFASTNFTILFPRDKSIVESLDTALTKIFVFVK